VNLLAFDRESAGEGDTDAVDPAEIRMGGDFFIAVYVVYSDLANFGKSRHIQKGLNLLAIGELDTEVIGSLAVDIADAFEGDGFAFDQRVEHVAAGGGVANKIERFGLGHSGGHGSELESIELPSIDSIVAHDDAAAVTYEDDDFNVVGLLLKSGEADHALGQMQGTFELDAFKRLPLGETSKGILVIITQDIGDVVVEASGVHWVEALDGLPILVYAESLGLGCAERLSYAESAGESESG